MSQRPATTIQQYVRFGVGSGASTVISLVLTVMLARQLAPGAFAEINVAIVIGAMVAGIGAGLDAAGSRLMARQGDDDADATDDVAAMVRYGRFRLLAVAAVVAGAVVLVGDFGRSIPRWAVTAIVVGHGMGLVAMSLSILRPIAFGHARPFAIRQVLYFTALLMAGALVVTADVTPAVLAVPGAAALAGYLWHPGRRRTRRPTSAFNALALSLVLSNILFALSDRLDVVVATARLGATDEADYAVASRITGIHILLTSVLTTICVARMSKADDLDSLKQAARRMAPAVLVSVVLSGVVALVGPTAIEIAFGEDFSGAASVLRILSVRYIVFALTAPLVVALPLVGRPRWQVELSLLQAVVIVLALLTATSPAHLAAAPVIGQVAGLVYLGVRLRHVRQFEGRPRAPVPPT